MATGKVAEFNPVKGYGLIQPDDGGSKVFFHADDFGGQRDLDVGTPVRFSSLSGRRGPKAYNVSVLLTSEREITSGCNSGRSRVANRCNRCRSSSRQVRALNYRGYMEEITDVLISEVPSITAAERAEVLKRLAKITAQHGWLERVR